MPIAQPPRRRARTTRASRAPLPIVECELSTITPHPRNARVHSAKQARLLEETVRRTRYMAPILIHADGRLIAGHLRVEVAKRMGWATIQAIVIDGLCDAEIEALMIADNRIAELARWDEALLAKSLEFIMLDDTLDFAPDLTGFDQAHIEALIHGPGLSGIDEADRVLPGLPSGPPLCALGDHWQVGDHGIVCGDALDRAVWDAALGAQRADLYLTDPPYNVSIQGHASTKKRHREFVQGSGELSGAQFITFLTDVFARMRQHARDGALAFVFMDGAHLFELFSAARAAGLTQKALCTWAKTNAGMGSLYRSQTEHVAVLKCGAASHVNNVALGRHGRNRTTLWSYPGMNVFGRARDAALAMHPTVKPVAMLADAMLDTTRRADLVVDPFLGSGSTIIAAHRIGRRAIGVERDPLYVDVALDRIAKVTGLDPVRARDGARWSELARTRDAARKELP